MIAATFGLCIGSLKFIERNMYSMRERESVCERGRERECVYEKERV